ncbi:MAG: hypothetical protein ABI652_09160, partial [Acidobacteriota bacterium]
ISSFAVNSSLMAFFHGHISNVTVDGLDIEISRGRPVGEQSPPQPGANSATATAGTSTKPAAAPGPVNPATSGATPAPNPAASNAKAAEAKAPGREFVIDSMTAKDAKLVIHPSEVGKHGKVWQIHTLEMQSLSADSASPFQAVLTNAVPPGLIEVKGSFGPWAKEDAGLTEVEGKFTFAHADLSVFKGISGILSSTGSFGGSLARIEVHGETHTPDFVVSTGGHPLPLQTTYHAIVDGTNGNTILEAINATLVKTTILAKGAVIDTPGPEGRTVSLDVTINRGRLEDVLRLAVNAPAPPLTGAISIKTKFVLPPGKNRTVVEKLQLNGTFVVAEAGFTSDDVQNKINELSQRSRGKSKGPEAPAERVTSHFEGKFSLRNGTLALPAIAFNVPGSVVELSGSYALVPATLDFTGMLFMDAKISETASGWKRLLLKAVDPLFKREGGGSAIPIKITGERSNPTFGLDRSRVFKRD